MYEASIYFLSAGSNSPDNTTNKASLSHLSMVGNTSPKK
jgi:hypothetical protein